MRPSEAARIGTYDIPANIKEYHAYPDALAHGVRVFGALPETRSETEASA